MITNKQADVLQHTSRTGRYVTSDPLVLEMAKEGLLYDHGPQQLAAGDHYLVTTPKGRAALVEWEKAQPPPPKPKRRRRSEAFEYWQNYVDACERISFRDFLRDIFPYREDRKWTGGL